MKNTERKFNKKLKMEKSKHVINIPEIYNGIEIPVQLLKIHFFSQK